MKKFLSILLALAVGFTFTFGSAMSAFASTEYTLDDYNAALQAEKTAQLSYLANAKAQAVNSYTYDKDTGFTSAGYVKAAYEAAADKVIADLTVAMDAKINEILNGKGTVSDFPTTTAPDRSEISKITADCIVMAGMKTALEAAKKDNALVLDLTQAPLTKAYIEGKLAVDFTKYNSTDKAYTVDGKEGTDLTAVQYINVLIDTAKKEIATADKKATAVEKIADYNTAYTKFDTAFKAVPTLDDEAFKNGQNAGAIEAAINDYATAGITFVDNAFAISNNMAADAKIDSWSSKITGDYSKFWEADKVTATKGKFFGVDIANINAITRTEAVAVKNAIYAAINNSKAVVKTYAKTVENVKALYKKSDVNDEETFINALNNAMNVADKYAEVVALGEKYKKSYEYGIKVYDDTNVDAAVKKAEELVYADLNSTLKDADTYIKNAAKALDISILAVNYELQKFETAVKDAAKKMYADGLTAKTAATKVLYGDNKTPEADYVYLKETYADADAWAKVAEKAVEKLAVAQSYDEITSIMADAATAFGKLMKADDAKDVKKAADAYKLSLAGYADQVEAMLDPAKYDAKTIAAAEKAGGDLIGEATTVDGVKAAFEEAKKLIDNVKSNDELKAMKEAVEKKIADLPYTAKLTAADKAAVKDAYDALAEYVKTPGSETINTIILVEKINKINELEAAAIKEEAKALKEKLDKVNGTSDADLAAFIAMKAEAEALVAKGDALKNEIKAVNDDIVVKIDTVALGTDYANIEHALEKVIDSARDTFYAKEIDNVESLLVQASKDGATEEQIKAALEAYNKLTDKQKYTLDADIHELAKTVEGKLNKFTDAEAKAYVQDLAIAVRTAKSGKKVKVTVKADVQTLIDNGYTVTYKFYKSTKKGSGYKNTVNKTTNTYTNTNPVKGKNYYKVKLVVKNADGTVVATTPLTQCKYGVRTIK